MLRCMIGWGSGAFPEPREYGHLAELPASGVGGAYWIFGVVDHPLDVFALCGRAVSGSEI